MMKIMAKLCSLNCGKAARLSCSLCNHSYCSRVCSMTHMPEHLKLCKVDEDLFRYSHETPMIMSCSNIECRKPGVQKKCSKCRVSYYCDEKCQAEDFPRHGANCQEVSSTITDVASFFREYPRHRRSVEYICLQKNTPPPECIVFLFHADDQRKTLVKQVSIDDLVRAFPNFQEESTVFKAIVAKKLAVVLVILPTGKYTYSGISCLNLTPK